MTGIDILRDLASRPLQAAERLRPQLDEQTLDAHPGGHPNSVAWLLWHAAREMDVQLASLAGTTEVWESGGFAERTGLGEQGAEIGYGHSAEQARAITLSEPGPVLEYLAATTGALQEHLSGLDEQMLDAVIDESWDPPVTYGVRLVSLIDDAAQHIGQAAYVVGMPARG